MLQIRLFENMGRDLWLQHRIHGAYHSYAGQEAVAVGACSALNKDDWICGTHRSHGHVIAKGAKLDRAMAELYFKGTGYNKGKGGSMHITDMSVGVLNVNSIVAGGIPIGTGAALSAKLRGTNQVTLVFFGEGASNRGTFHEAINHAAVWRLPVIFLCENNLYNIHTYYREVTSVADISMRSTAYAMPGLTVDGNDVLAVYVATKQAVKRARTGEGPTLVECKTYKWYDHMNFAGSEVGRDGAWGLAFRSDDELRSWMEKDPIKLFRTRLMGSGILTEESADEVVKDVQKEVEEAVSFAESSPYPDPEEALTDNYA
ncbi:MAG: thiamine pyrophosphate-dependent dehydrogenase E1 component subunit alpha [Candidatus Hydrogenedentota bacterium]|nr:MAG: thiamine pyrophosphate-dependent dehydrogenase E1 component subunit alpha [Candidatus Hydrogenedentota bacterium]